MGESQRLLNPWLLHLQKLALELKCPLCLDLLNRPVLLPCNHIFCSSCIQGSSQVKSQCPACKCQYVDQETRLAPYMENIVSIYKSLDAIQPVSYDVRKCSDPCPVSVRTNSNDDTKREHNGAAADGNSSNGNSLFPATVKKCNHNLLNDSAEHEVVLTGKSVKATFTRNYQQLELDNHGGDKLGFNGEDSSTHLQISGQVGDVKSTKAGMVEIEMNKMEQLLADIDDNSSDPGFNRDAKRQKKSNSPDESGGMCAFCHSSEITDDTGPMLHYSNGKLVVGAVKSFSKVIYVHKICIDWTPQVYYQGDNIRNLESELARAAKLKCSRCGRKGAALGCYARTCRKTYHVPCAVKIADCRWDFDDFIMTCPIHNAVKFPREKAKSRKHASAEASVSAPLSSQLSSFWLTVPGGAKEWVFCGSALSTEEKYYLVKFASSCGASVSSHWKPSVTHVIAAIDANGAYTRTLKVLMAILHGKWVITLDWVKACLEASKPVDEETYELSLDNHGCRDGPKTGRLRTADNSPKLFSGFDFYFSGDFLQAYKNDLLSLVRTAGGTIIEDKEELVAQVCNGQSTAITLVVYNADPLQRHSLGNEYSIVLQRRKAAEDLARELGCQVLKHTWLLESIAACKLQPCC